MKVITLQTSNHVESVDPQMYTLVYISMKAVFIQGGCAETAARITLKKEVTSCLP